MSGPENTKLASAVRSNDQITALLLPYLPPGNLIVSSFSLGSALGMVLAGAKGKTRQQILKFFGANEEKEVAMRYIFKIFWIIQYLMEYIMTIRRSLCNLGKLSLLLIFRRLHYVNVIISSKATRHTSYIHVCTAYHVIQYSCIKYWLCTTYNMNI